VTEKSLKAPLFYFAKRLNERLQKRPPGAKSLKPVKGVRLSLFRQVPLPFELGGCEKVFLFCPEPGYFAPEDTGEFWYSEKEREALTEFGVLSRHQVAKTRRDILLKWVSESKECLIWDTHYSAKGKECANLTPLLTELGLLTEENQLECQEMGAHPRWAQSWLSGIEDSLKVQNQTVQLEMQDSDLELSASFLDRYSRCPFQALSLFRWSLKDERQASLELWPDVKGKVLHSAVQALLESRDVRGVWSRTSEEVLEAIIRDQIPKGLLFSPLLWEGIRQGMVSILNAFIEKEDEYFIRAENARVLYLEGPDLRLEIEGVKIRGRPDRVDETPDGLFVMDFKTSAAQIAKGVEMLDQGYKLQLPFYALALEDNLRADVAGAQFIELNQKGTRSSGIFQKSLNGKEKGKLSNSRAKMSLFDEPRDLIWKRAQNQISNEAKKIKSGLFSPKPKIDLECRSCRLKDLCGVSRKPIDVGEIQ
jgi:hypothetical protein